MNFVGNLQEDLGWTPDAMWKKIERVADEYVRDDDGIFTEDERKKLKSIVLDFYKVLLFKRLIFPMQDFEQLGDYWQKIIDESNMLNAMMKNNNN